MKHTEATDNVIPLKDRLNEKNLDLKKNTNDHQKTRVLAIASGKGGVGKTNIVANLGFSLSQMGKKILILDADMGLGNIDILLGLTPKYNLSHVLLGEKGIEEITVDGPGGMKIIPAASGIQELTDLSKKQQLSILDKLDRFINGFDMFLIDTAAGISNNVLHFNAAAQEVMVIISPEPTSITDAYALMKILSRRYDVRRFNLIVNSVHGENEAVNVFRQLQIVTHRFLDIHIEFIGHVTSDENISKGVRRQKLVTQLYPKSPSSECFKGLAKKISEMKCNKAGMDFSNFQWKNLIQTN